MDVAENQTLVEKWSEEFHGRQAPNGPGWLQELRDKAAAQFGISGLPGRKHEAWKYTPMRLLEGLNPSTDEPAESVHSSASFPAPVTVASSATVTVCNGVLAPELPQTLAGVTLLPLAAGVQAFEKPLRSLLSAVELDGASRVFSALNTAFLDQGLVIHVSENIKAGTLLIQWAFSREEVAVLGNFRLVVLLERGAELEIVEQFESETNTAGALNVLVQADLGEASVLKHLRVQNESDEVVLLTSTSVEQAAGSFYRYSGFDLGGGLVRHELDATLAGDEAHVSLDGAFVLDGKRHVDNHVSVDHASPGCSSSQFFRGVLGGKSRGVFNGRALIRPGADGSSVRQSNANLLLSPLAEIDTKPELEIYADEVEASHGATVGQLDEAAVFYMRTRGLTDEEARRMLTSAFCHAVSDRLEDRGLADRISEMMDRAMPSGGLTAQES